NPLFEAPDEHWHFFTAEFIARSRRLPQVTAPPDPWLSQEAAQPPLYYLLGAALIAPIDTAGARQAVWLNPFASVGNAADLTNLNRAVHGAWEAWPWQGYALAAHVLRLFSTLLGLGTLLCLHASARLLWPADARRALLATAVVAFLPQFNFLHASITNDALIIFLCAAALLQLLQLYVQQTAGAPPPRRRLLLLGITIGLAALSKTAGILLWLYALGFIGILWLRGKTEARDWRSRANLQSLISNLLLLSAPVLALAGWLWLRSWALYGDPTAASQFVAFAGGDRGYSLWQVLAESGGLWRSLFAVFGWFNVLPPAWVFWVWNGIVLAAAVGGMSALRAGEKSALKALFSPAWLLFTWLLLVYAGLAAFMLRTEAAQGRLLFPALLPLALGLAAGLAQWRRRAAFWLPPLLALGTTLACLLGTIAPAYAPPPLLDALPADVPPLNADMGQGLTLLGARMETETAVPGDPVTLTLYWRAETRPPTNAEFKLELLGRDLAPIAELHSYHGRGLYPAPLWPPGRIVADQFSVRLDEAAAAPVLARAFVRLVAAEGPGVQVGEVKVAPAAWPAAPEPALARIGEGVELTAVSLADDTAQPGGSVRVDVTWRVTAAPGVDLTTLLHLGPGGAPPLATGDAPPLGGDYPTRAWAAGEVITDRYTLPIPPDLPPGAYPVWIGMYDSASITRLPLTANGARQPADTLQIGTLTVTKVR
ncbi:MAG: DUF2142 domain-containing protein, partial [Anaerolineales bacterium]|nr:DUF2142 domain-containing protein [Anaerolineales bacterium]